VNKERAFGMHDEMCANEQAIRAKKAHDYSAKTDVLSNFKLQADIFAAFDRHGCPVDVTTPHGCAMYLQILKVIRAANLVAREEAPENESIDDTALDGRVYWELFRECYVEYMEERTN
jgi:hypothetical protein